MKETWLYISQDDLRTELEQIADEGKDTSSVEGDFKRLLTLDMEGKPSFQAEAEALLDKTVALTSRKGYAYREPSDLPGIRKERPAHAGRHAWKRGGDNLFDNVLGAWQGRCAGCLLGKPVEGWRSGRMWGYLKALKRFPLKDYFRSDIPPAVARKFKMDSNRAFIDRVDHMPEDDDTNYTVTGLALMKQYGKFFTPVHVARFWLSNIPILHTCTAERVAYRNLSQLIAPPRSAAYRNVYREWIGAQIRADFFGYAALGDPALAAEFAWRDACISHVKNGIYGEMWVAAMLAAAPFEDEIEKIIGAGLAQIPRRSRLTRAIRDVLEWRAAGLSYFEAIGRIHARWDETKGHHWCHTISNAQIVALGLLWSENDFEKGICRAVEACFDTDCNGATVGSILGMKLGAGNLPAKWIAPLNDRLDTGIAGYNSVKISELARQGFELYRAIS